MLEGFLVMMTVHTGGVPLIGGSEVDLNKFQEILLGRLGVVQVGKTIDDREGDPIPFKGGEGESATSTDTAIINLVVIILDLDSRVDAAPLSPWSKIGILIQYQDCLLYTSPSPRDQRGSRMPSSA